MRKHSSHHNTATFVRKRCDDKISYYIFLSRLVCSYYTTFSFLRNSCHVSIHTEMMLTFLVLMDTIWQSINIIRSSRLWPDMLLFFCRGRSIGFFKANTLTILDEAWKDMQAYKISWINLFACCIYVIRIRICHFYEYCSSCIFIKMTNFDFYNINATCKQIDYSIQNLNAMEISLLIAVNFRISNSIG